MNVLPLEETTHPDYHGWEDNKRIIIENSTHSTVGYVDDILSTRISARKGSIWFIPADHKKTTHVKMRDCLRGKNFATFIVNGDGIELTIPGVMKSIEEPKKEELNVQLKRLYKENNLERYPVAITGHYCVTRGITIASEDFRLDGAILSNSQNKEEVSQTAGRMKGKWKKWENYSSPIVITTPKFDKIACMREEQSRNLAKMALDNTTQTRDDYLMAAHKNSNIEHTLFESFESAKAFSQKHIMTKVGKPSRPQHPQMGSDGFLKGERRTFEELEKYIKNSSWKRNGAASKKVFNYYLDKTDPESIKWAVFYIKSGIYYRE